MELFTCCSDMAHTKANEGNGTDTATPFLLSHPTPARLPDQTSCSPPLPPTATPNTTVLLRLAPRAVHAAAAAAVTATAAWAAVRCAPHPQAPSRRRRRRAHAPSAAATSASFLSNSYTPRPLPTRRSWDTNSATCGEGGGTRGGGGVSRHGCGPGQQRRRTPSPARLQGERCCPGWAAVAAPRCCHEPRASPGGPLPTTNVRCHCMRADRAAAKQLPCSRSVVAGRPPASRC